MASTLVSSVTRVSPGDGLGTWAQRAPSQCSTRGFCAPEVGLGVKNPTAQASDADSAATPSRQAEWAAPGLGVATCAQRVPSQCSTRSLATRLMVAPPTAHAPVADTALTADRPLPCAPPGLGLGTCDQRLPSQRSTRSLATRLMVAPPTAHPPVADTALTADRPLPCAPPGLGLGTCDQRLPSQCTASVLNTLALVS